MGSSASAFVQVSNCIGSDPWPWAFPGRPRGTHCRGGGRALRSRSVTQVAFGGLLLRILDRYILREVVVSWFAVTGVLLAILLTNQVARVLERAAESQYPRGVVLELILLERRAEPVAGGSRRVAARHRAGARAPVSRQRDDRGAGLRRRARAPSSCRCWDSPRCWPCCWQRCPCILRRPPRAACSSCAARRCAPGSSRPSAPGKFRTFGGGSTVVYAQGADPDGTLRRVFVRARPRRASGDRAGAARHACLLRGRRPAGDHAVRRRALRRHSGRAPLPHRALRREHHPGAAAGDVGRRRGARRRAHPQRCCIDTTARRRAEFHWRIAFPIMARGAGAASRIPLARLRPRQGRYARVGYAVLIFFVYINLAIAGTPVARARRDPAVVRPVVGARRGGAAGASPSCSCRAGARGRAIAATCAHAARRGGAGMNLLDRYVIRAVLGGVFVVLAVLLALGALFLFANQQDDIGVGTYTRARRVLVRAAQPAAAGLRAHAHRAC